MPIKEIIRPEIGINIFEKVDENIENPPDCDLVLWNDDTTPFQLVVMALTAIESLLTLR